MAFTIGGTLSGRWTGSGWNRGSVGLAALAAFGLVACGGGGGGGSGGGDGQATTTNVAATFFGGKNPSTAANDRAQGVFVLPGSERVMIAGNTGSSDYEQRYPGKPGYDKTFNGSSDAYVAILSADLSSVVAWTYLGGNAEDRGYQAIADSQGNIWVVGFSGSPNFPVAGGGDANHGMWDAFVAKYSPNLSQLLFCTSLGGSHDENPRGSIGIDAFDNIYVSGHTESNDFAMSALPGNVVFDATYNGARDAFVVKLDPSGGLVWSTFFGGSGDDAANANVRVNSDGNSIYVGGDTNSDAANDHFPVTAGAFQTVYGGEDPQNPGMGDGWVARFSGTGQRLACTYIGGASNDYVLYDDALELNSFDEVVVIGTSQSDETTFPLTSNAFQAQHQGGTSGETAADGFVGVFSEDLSTLIYCTYLGGGNRDEPSGLGVDAAGRIYVSGDTESANFPTTSNAFAQDYSGNVDAFIVQLSYDANSSTLDYGTYFGGFNTAGSGFFGDRARGLDLRPSDGAVVIAGDSDAKDMPVTAGALGPKWIGGLSDAFVAIHDTQP